MPAPKPGRREWSAWRRGMMRTGSSRKPIWAAIWWKACCARPKRVCRFGSSTPAGEKRAGGAGRGALYERGRVKHVGAFPALEDQLCGMMTGGDYVGPGRSPDRADALVWALSELMLGRRADYAIRSL